MGILDIEEFCLECLFTPRSQGTDNVDIIIGGKAEQRYVPVDCGLPTCLWPAWEIISAARVVPPSLEQPNIKHELKNTKMEKQRAKGIGTTRNGYTLE